jgi:phosphoglycerate dehydrogenase-like enzyme
VETFFDAREAFLYNLSALSQSIHSRRRCFLKVVFAETDKMFKLIGEALAPSAGAEKFLGEFFLTESADPVALMRRWSERKGMPANIQVTYCARANELKEMMRDADVLVVENTPIDSDHIENASALKLIQGFGRQLPKIDAAACAARNIIVRPLDRHTNRLVAEHVIMLVLALTRALDRSRAALRDRSSLLPSGWAYNWPACQNIKGLAGRVVGLVGLGQTGAMVAEYLRPFGATVLYTRRTRNPDVEKELGIHYVSLDELVARSDVLSLHVPVTAETRNLVSAELLKRAKPGVLIVNTARGSLIDEQALVAALQSGKVGGAALDVFVSEPLSPEHPLLNCENVILTPHVAGGTRDEAWLDRELGPVVDSILSVM